MIDIKLIRENPELVKDSQKKRGLDTKSVNEILDLDNQWRETKQENDKIRAERNSISKEINEAKKLGKNISPLFKRAKEIPEILKENEQKLREIEEKRSLLLGNIPNLVDKTVPVGDATKNKILKEYGKLRKFNFPIKGHEEILLNLDYLDLERAAKVAGSRFYYLKRDLVKLNQAIINYALDLLRKKGFILVQPPYMINKKALSGAVTLDAFEEMIYKIQDEDLYLIGTAEHALNAYYMDEIIPINSLPIRFAGVSPCFRKEAGSHGKDTKGIFRIHQFEKIEQFVFSKPEESWKEFDLILNSTIELLKGLKIPFRTVVLSSQEMGRVSTKTIDLEGYFPTQKIYRELGSCSNCLDYQARRSNIKYQEKGETKFVHTLNNTAIATERMIVCLVENYQQADGSIKIPDVLVPYMHGKKFINGDRKV